MVVKQVPAERTERRPVGNGGKRLDRSRDAAILGAAREGLAEVGYDRLTMDSIAARAHAGKGALYRRWPSKAALVVDAIVAWREELSPMASIEDTGSIRGDFEALLGALPNLDDAARRQIAVFAGLVSAAIRDPELKALLATHVLDRPRRTVETVLARGIARGEIPTDRPLGLIPDLIVGLNFVHVMSGIGSDRDYMSRVLDEVVIPLVAPPASSVPRGADAPQQRRNALQ